MPNAIITATSGPNKVTPRLVPRLCVGSSWQSGTRWYCEEVWTRYGAQPSMATVVIPCVAENETANTVAFNPDGPAQNIKIGTRCIVEALIGDNARPVFAGSVVRVIHDRDKNALVLLVYDDRWLLQNIRVIGRWIFVVENADDATEHGPAYQEGWPAHFNPGGRPNGIWYNGVPYFAAYPDFGLSDGEEPPAASDRNESQACYWTLSMILLYLRSHYGSSATAVSQFPFLATAPETLEWPDTFAAGVDAMSAANFDDAVGQNHSTSGNVRKGREVLLEGISLLDAIELLLVTAGGVTLWLQPQVSGSEIANTLVCVPTRYLSESNAVSIPFACGGSAQTALSRACVTGGTYEEDGSDFVSSQAGAGQIVFVERRLSTKTGDGAQLIPAWTSARFDQFRSLAAGNSITIDGNTIQPMSSSPSPSCWQQARRVLPEVLTTWRLKKSYNVQESTAFVNYPRAQIARPPWPTLLSFLSDAGVTDFAGQRCPIYVEVETSTNVWVTAGQFDGMEVFDNGIIHIPMLAELYADYPAWKWNNAQWAEVDNMLDISVLNIRMVLAIPLDHRVTSFCTSPTDSAQGDFTYDDNPDADRIEATLERRGYLDLQELYQLHLRKNSWTRPESLKYVQAEDKAGAFEFSQHTITAASSVRSDHAQLAAHVRRSMWENCRVRGGGMLRFDGYLVTTYTPGMAVKDLVPIGADGRGPLPVRKVIAGIKWNCSPEAVATGLELT